MPDCQDYRHKTLSTSVLHSKTEFRTGSIGCCARCLVLVPGNIDVFWPRGNCYSHLTNIGLSGAWQKCRLPMTGSGPSDASVCARRICRKV